MADFRFPGTRPFESHENKLFFGREHEAQALYQQLRLQQTVLLYSKSGLGKSSLINAGLLPLLRQSGRFRPIRIRFTRYNGAELGQATPFERTVAGLIARGRGTRSAERLDGRTRSLPKIDQVERNYIDRVIAQENSLWYFAKKWQSRTPDTPTLVLIFDQFEELFSYPTAEVFRFKKQLAELLLATTPQHFRKVLEVKQRKQPDLLSPAELDLLETPVRVKVLFAIRSDRMSELDSLRDFLPHVLHHTFELKALQPHQARQAMLLPATAQGSFGSPAFEFSESLADSLLQYLSAQGSKDIETFQLQLVCKYAEDLATEQNKTRFDVGDLGSYPSIFQTHYDRTIGRLNPEQQHAARLLIEEQLIVEGSRVTLSDAAVLRSENRQAGIDAALLQLLLDSHLVRSEPNSLGGFSYELAHDTLVPPILESRQIRIDRQRLQAQLGPLAQLAEIPSEPISEVELVLRLHAELKDCQEEQTRLRAEIHEWQRKLQVMKVLGSMLVGVLLFLVLLFWLYGQARISQLRSKPTPAATGWVAPTHAIQTTQANQTR